MAGDPARAAGDSREGDDLFDFDDLIAQSEQVASELEAELDQVLDRVGQPGDLRPSPKTLRSPAAPVTAPPAGRALAPIALAVLIAVALANVVFVGLTWKSLASTRELLAGVVGANHPPAPLPEVEPPAPERPHREAPPLEDASRNASAALEAGQIALEAGEHGQARRSLYALLATIDGLEPGERSDLEARARLLVADAYRLEARAAPAGPGGEE